MKKHIFVTLTTSLILVGVALGGSAQTNSPETFAVANVHFEQNATDGDVEVVFDVKAGDEGLVKLRVTSPDGRAVVDLSAPDHSTLGLRQFQFESPEPEDIQRLKSAYPEGVYTYAGSTASGKRFRGESTLSHRLPAIVTLLDPKGDARGVSAKHLTISWSPVENLRAYIVEIEQDELNVNLTVKLPESARSFAVPDGFLVPDTEYDLSIGTVDRGGNISFVETGFTTAE